MGSNPTLSATDLRDARWRFKEAAWRGPIPYPTRGLRLVAPLISVTDPRAVLSYAAATIFLFVFVVIVRMAQGRRQLRFRPLFRLIGKRSVWLHPSALLDYRMYLLNLPLLVFGTAYFIVGSDVWAGLAGRALDTVFGVAAPAAHAGWLAAALVAGAVLLALDFGYWLGHLAMHRSATLWEFHKVHHSAAVLTPATEFRQHPVEYAVVPGAMALTSGIVLALSLRFAGPAAAALGQTGANIIFGLHIFTFHHLRHSHINMRFSGLAGRLLQSPAHHLIHHSDHPIHADRNLGYLLSVWDWAAGTLVQPAKGYRPTIGIGAEGADFDSVSRLLWLPVRNVGRRLAGLARRAA